MDNSGWFLRYTALSVAKDVTFNDIHNQNTYIHSTIIRFTSVNCILAGLNGC